VFRSLQAPSSGWKFWSHLLGLQSKIILTIVVLALSLSQTEQMRLQKVFFTICFDMGSDIALLNGNHNQRGRQIGRRIVLNLHPLHCCLLLLLSQCAETAADRGHSQIRHSNQLGIAHCSFPCDDQNMQEFTILHTWLSVAVLPPVNSSPSSSSGFRLRARGYALFYGDKTSLVRGPTSSPQMKNAAGLIKHIDKYKFTLRYKWAFAAC
jgi:hypothetical protein